MVGPVVQVGGAVAAHAVHRAGIVGLVLTEPEVNGLALGDLTIAVQVIVDTAVAGALLQGHGRAAVGLHGQAGVSLDDRTGGAGDRGVGLGQGAQTGILGIQGAGGAAQILGGCIIVGSQLFSGGQGVVQLGQRVSHAGLVAGVLPAFELFGSVRNAIVGILLQGGADLGDLGQQGLTGGSGGVLGLAAGSGLIGSAAGAHGGGLDDDVVVLAGQQVVGANIAGDGSGDVSGLAQLEADVLDLAGLRAIDVDGQCAVAAVGLLVDEGEGVPLADGDIAQRDLVLADTLRGAVNTVAHLAVIGQQVQTVAAGADRKGGAHGGLGFVAARFLDHHIGQQGELGAAKQVLCVGDGRMVVILVVPLGGNLQDGIPGVIGQGSGVGSQRQAAVVLQHLVEEAGLGAYRLAVDSQPADNRSLGAGGGDGVADDLVLINGEGQAVDDVAAAAGQVQRGGVGQGVALGIGHDSGHRAVHAPPLAVGTGQGVGTGGQGQRIGQGLALRVVLAVDAGSRLVGGAGVALGACVGIDKAPGVGVGLDLVELVVQQLVAQRLLVQFVGLGGAASHAGRITGHGIDEVNSVAGDDLGDLNADGQGLAQRIDGVLHSAADGGGLVGVRIQCVGVNIPFN